MNAINLVCFVMYGNFEEFQHLTIIDFSLAVIGSLASTLGHLTYSRAYQVTEASKVAAY